MQSISKQKNKKSYKKLIVLIAIILVLLAGASYVALAHPFNRQQTTTSPENSPTRPVNSVDYNPPTEQNKQDSQDAKQRDINQQQNNPPTNPSITVTIARAGQTGAGQPLSVRTTIGGITNGTCNATLTSNGQTVTGSGTVTLTGTSYACNIDIPTSSFPTGGQWQLSITATNGSATSPAATQTVTITK
jgi:cytoskeletal protein RodZ